MRIHSVLLTTALVATMFVGATPAANAATLSSGTVTPNMIAPVEGGGGGQSCHAYYGWVFCN